jgi:hypothetical protein
MSGAMAKVGMSGLVLVLALSGCSEAGKQGPAGEPGAQGEPGANGVDGKNGVDGAVGAPGDTGAPGTKGDTGAQGDPGAQGDTGAMGAMGAMGVKGDTGAKGDPGVKGDPGGAGGSGGSAASALRAPGFALLDADGKVAEALPVQNYYTPYAQPHGRTCVGLLWIGQLYAAEFQVDLATGRGEPCYPHANGWSAVPNGTAVFASTNCSGDALGPYGYERVVVNNAFVEARGADVGPIGKGTAFPFSYYVNGICENHTADQTQTIAVKFVPVDTRFSEAFKNPPYVYKIVY